MIIDKQKLSAGWKWVKLKDVCEIIAGQSPPSSTYRKEPVGLPFFQGKADFGDIYPNATTWCVEPYKLALPGDILISIRAPVGPTNVADMECCIGRGLAAIRCGNEIVQEFLLSALRRYESVLTQKGSGSTFQAIGRKELESFEIPLPPLSEQKRIAKILNDQLAAVEKARQAAQEQLNAARTLPEVFLREIFSNANLKRWPRRNFGEITKIDAKQVNPTLPEYRNLPHVNGENIESGTGRITYLNTAAEEQMISGKYLFNPNCILYSKLRPYLRKAAFVDFQGLCSADIYPIEVDEEILTPQFTLWMLLSDEFTEYAINQSQRARMPKLNRDQLFAWEAPVPPIKEQHKLIEKLARQIEESRRLETEVNNQYNEISVLPSLVLQKAFQGGF